MQGKYDLKSELFVDMLNDLDMYLKETLYKIYNLKDLEEGTINLKISLKLNKVEVDDEEYKRPFVEYDISAAFKEQFKSKGVVGTEDGLKQGPDGFYLEPIPDPQMNLEDICND